MFSGIHIVREHTPPGEWKYVNPRYHVKMQAFHWQSSLVNRVFLNELVMLELCLGTSSRQ